MPVRIGVLVLVLAMLAGITLWASRPTPPPRTPAPAEEKTAMATDPNEPHVPQVSRLSQGEALPQTEEEWKKRLTPEQFRVMRQKGTERPFSGEFYRTDAQGTYRCAGCGETLFSSETKFDAHCGWPSFWKAVDDGNLKTLDDDSHGMHRTEVQCGRCGAHLGHLFDDGPHPTGLRYCINSVSLQFDEAQTDSGDDGAVADRPK